jgi:hypothetical protein
MTNELVKRLKEDRGDRILQPLRRKEMVLLTVSDDRMPRKKRIGKPILIITELPYTEEPTLLFALPGYGCEAMPVKKLNAGLMIRMGLRAKAAKALIRELKKLYEVRNDGN